MMSKIHYYILVLAAVILLNVTDRLPQGSDHPFHRQRLYGDIDPRYRVIPTLNRQSSPALAQPDLSQTSTSALAPDIFRYTNVYYEMYSYATNRYGIYKCSDCRNGLNPSALFFDGNTDNYEPEASQDSSQVVFVSYLKGNADIFSRRADGNGFTQLTFDSAADYSPTWSPNGSKIAFVSKRSGNNDIFVMAANGTIQTRLTTSANSDFSPTWSPDGTKIAWIHALNGGYGQIYIMDANGSNQQSIGGAMLYLSDLAWSPDGARFAFSFDANGDDFIEPYTLKTNGGDLTQVQLTHYSSSDQFVSGWGPKSSYLVINTVFYIYQNDAWYISGTSIDLIDVDNYYNPINGPISVDGVNSNSIGVAFNPYLDLTDRLAPATNIAPLPPFSKAFFFPVSWSATDPGPSGLYSTLLYRQIEPNTDWAPIASKLDINQSSASGVLYFNDESPYDLGKVISFYAQARDYADNLQSQMNTVNTTLYRYAISGQFFDLRGHPITKQTAQASSAIAAPLSQPDGSFSAYFTEKTASDFSFSGSFTFGLPPAHRDVQVDDSLTLALPPENNLVINGNFENASALQGWTKAGDELPGDTSGATGDHGVRLGTACDTILCLSQTQIGDAFYPSTYSYHMDIDSQDNLHVMIENHYYSRSHGSSTWSPALNLAETSSMFSLIHVGPQDALHAVVDWQYYKKPSAGSWSTPELIPHPSDWLHPGALTTDASGNPIFISYSIGYIHVQKRTSAGVWPEIFTHAMSEHGAMAVAKDGTIYLYDNGGFNSNAYFNGLAIVSSDGKLTQTNSYPPLPITYPSITVDKQGGLHLITRGMYLYRNPNGSWSLPQLLDQDMEGPRIKVSDDGSVWVYWTNLGLNEYPLGYMVKRPGSAIFQKITPPAGQVRLIDSVFDSNSDLILFAYSGYAPVTLWLLSPAMAETSTESSLSQEITIPADMHQPTLSFLYRLDGSATASAQAFNVQVIPAGGSPTSVFHSGSPVYNWTLGWADLSAWAGQTVTIRMDLNKTAGEPVLSAQVDDISASTWSTPVVDEVSPSLLLMPLPANALITLHGQNFMREGDSPPALFLDGQPIPCNWVSDTELQFNLPTGITTGHHSIEVINPSGYSAFLPNGVAVELRHTYLPSVKR